MLKCGIQLPNIQEIKKRKKGSQVISSNLSAKKYKVLKSGDEFKSNDEETERKATIPLWKRS